VESSTQIAYAAIAATAANGKVIAANASEVASTTKISAAGKCVGRKRGTSKNKDNCKGTHSLMPHV
jgi:hypothetical protein